MIISGVTIKDTNFNNPRQVVGQVSYTTPGTYSWTAPADVHSVCVVAVGGGGGGDVDLYGGSYGAGGGGGGQQTGGGGGQLLRRAVPVAVDFGVDAVKTGAGRGKGLGHAGRVFQHHGARRTGAGVSAHLLRGVEEIGHPLADALTRQRLVESVEPGDGCIGAGQIGIGGANRAGLIHIG